MMAATLPARVLSSFLVTSTVFSPKKCPKTMLITTANTKIAAAKYPASFQAILFRNILLPRFFNFKAIAYAPNSFHIPFRMLKRVQLGPQSFNMAVHRAAVPVVIVTPDTVQQIIPAENLLIISRQGIQKFFFPFSERHFRAVNSHQIIININNQVSHGQNLGLVVPLGTDTP